MKGAIRNKVKEGKGRATISNHLSIPPLYRYRENTHHPHLGPPERHVELIRHPENNLPHNGHGRDTNASHRLQDQGGKQIAILDAILEIKSLLLLLHLSGCPTNHRSHVCFLIVWSLQLRRSVLWQVSGARRE